MADIVSVGVGVGLLTAAWCLVTGGTLAFAFLAYSVGGSAGTVTAALFIATQDGARRRV
jgi:hypothetical protein